MIIVNRELDFRSEFIGKRDFDFLFLPNRTNYTLMMACCDKGTSGMHEKTYTLAKDGKQLIPSGVFGFSKGV